MSNNVDTAIEQAKQNAIATDAFLNSVSTSKVDGTTCLNIELFPNLDTEVKLFKLKKCHIKLVVWPQSEPQKPEGKQKPKKKKRW